MMFLLDSAFSLGLIALSFGIGFLVWSARNDGAGITLAKAFGYIITILAIFGLLCTGYYGINYWLKGYFKSPMAPMMMKHQMIQQQIKE